MLNRSLLLGLFASVALSLVSGLLSFRESWMSRSDRSGSVLKRLFGDGRRMFGNHFFAKADAYFHRGAYPSIFDEAKSEGEHHMAGGTPEHQDGEEKHEHAGHDDGPRDWIEWLNRHTAPQRHMELEGAETREILPWLKLAAELDPQRIETYTVAAYWLRTRLGKTAEAEHFLREGLRSNPGSYAILFELGRLIQDNHQDLTHACNVYDLALRHWEKQEAANPQPDLIMLGQILMVSAKAEEERGDLVKAISYLDRLKAISPNPAAIQMQIDVVRGRMPVPR